MFFFPQGRVGQNNFYFPKLKFIPIESFGNIFDKLEIYFSEKNNFYPFTLSYFFFWVQQLIKINFFFEVTKIFFNQSGLIIYLKRSIQNYFLSSGRIFWKFCIFCDGICFFSTGEGTSK